MTIFVMIAEWKKAYSTDCGDFMLAIIVDFLIVPGIVLGLIA